MVIVVLIVRSQNLQFIKPAAVQPVGVQPHIAAAVAAHSLHRKQRARARHHSRLRRQHSPAAAHKALRALVHQSHRIRHHGHRQFHLQMIRHLRIAAELHEQRQRRRRTPHSVHLIVSEIIALMAHHLRQRKSAGIEARLIHLAAVFHPQEPGLIALGQTAFQQRHPGYGLHSAHGVGRHIRHPAARHHSHVRFLLPIACRLLLKQHLTLVLALSET